MKPDWENVKFYGSLKLTLFVWFMLSLGLLVPLRYGYRSSHTGRVGFWFAVLLLCWGVSSAYQALSGEITGKALYSTSRFSYEVVTRNSSPIKFRRATNMEWGWTGFCLIAGSTYARMALRARSQQSDKAVEDH